MSRGKCSWESRGCILGLLGSLVCAVSKWRYCPECQRPHLLGEAGVSPVSSDSPTQCSRVSVSQGSCPHPILPQECQQSGSAWLCGLFCDIRWLSVGLVVPSGPRIHSLVCRVFPLLSGRPGPCHPQTTSWTPGFLQFFVSHLSALFMVKNFCF